MAADTVAQEKQEKARTAILDRITELAPSCPSDLLPGLAQAFSSVEVLADEA